MDDRHESPENPYRAFNRLSEELSSAYFGLADRVAGLEAELARSRQEKERQREEKQHLADRLSALLDSLPGGVVVHDSAGRVTAGNAVARSWFGLELTGRTWPELLAAGRLRPVDGGRELEAEDGSQLTTSRRYLPGRRETIILLTDVTEQRQLQAALEQNRRLATMGEMAARVAHQLRTPLSTALLYANHLTEAELEPGQRQAFGAKLLARLRDLDRLTRDMLGFVRGSRRRPRDLSLAALFDDVRQTLDAGVREGGALRIGGDGGFDGSLCGDRQALAGALCNLVENAWQVGGPGTLVELSARRAAGGCVEILVDDDGPGVSDELRERIFEPFFSDRSGGTGLGLPLARSVAEAHGGTLRLVARPGGGARFVLALPLAPGRGDAVAPLALAEGAP
ncbi:MAG: sensor histidine kinase [Pseudohaliea sp.]